MSTSCTIPGLNVPKSRFPEPESDLPTGDNREQRVVLGGGCFWCVEAVFLAVNGVSRVESGYAGGTAETANYEAVCGGQTDHAEVVDVHYDPQTVSFGDILKVFFSVAHDPTSLTGRETTVVHSTVPPFFTRMTNRNRWRKPTFAN